MSELYMVAGLGNPGSKYVRTRHNAGFDTIEILAARWGVSFGKSEHMGLSARHVYEGRRVILVRPETYMNESGRCIKSFHEYYSIPLNKIIVVYDDIDLPLGCIRIRANGGAGTHNGMRSIIFQIGAEDFPRVRIGIGKPPPEWQLSDFVLSRYPEELHGIMFDAYTKAALAVETILSRGVEAAQQEYNVKQTVDIDD